MINRKEVLKRNNPKLNKVEYHSPLSVGNGEFAYTVDVTGLQTLYDEYDKNGFPLCTMSQWGWHTCLLEDKNKKKYTLDDLIMTRYLHENKEVFYPVKKFTDNEFVYNWLRENPHKFNLMRLGFIYNNNYINSNMLENINQELDLYNGIINSSFDINNKNIKVKTFVDEITDTIGLEIKSELLLDNKLELTLEFPYGSSSKNGSDWSNDSKHKTIIKKSNNMLIIERYLDEDKYFVVLNSSTSFDFKTIKSHAFHLSFPKKEINLTINFLKELEVEELNYSLIYDRNIKYWNNFWIKSGFIDFSNSKDLRAFELERRIILSLYLMAIQTTGSLPPQESGLSCNTWYGKFHLEMHLWHNAFLPLWNHTDLLNKVIPWYKKILPLARYNASKNGYKGSRWPKMTGIDGIDSPSPIAPLLVWQQSHIIYMLELMYQDLNSKEFLNDNYILIKETADFMCDFLVLKDGHYQLTKPLIPAQERFHPETVLNPTFEIEYWRFCLKLAILWSERLNKKEDKWVEVYNNIIEVKPYNDLLLSYEGCIDTFTKYNKDHPSMIGALGIIPNDRIDYKYFKNTLSKIKEVWDFKTMWGWDFAMMAMTYTRLNMPNEAIDILLMDTFKNKYYQNGHNFQESRPDLPVYLPGNGSLLLACAMMIAGFDGSDELPGIPKDGSWSVKFENIKKVSF